MKRVLVYTKTKLGYVFFCFFVFFFCSFQRGLKNGEKGGREKGFEALCWWQTGKAESQKISKFKIQIIIIIIFFWGSGFISLHKCGFPLGSSFEKKTKGRPHVERNF